MAAHNDTRSPATEQILFNDDIIRLIIACLPLGSAQPGIGLSQLPASAAGHLNCLSTLPEDCPYFAINRQILTKSSKWMQKVLADRSITFIQQSYASESTLNMYLNWLCTGRFPTRKAEQAEDTTDDDSDDEYLSIPYDDEGETLALVHRFAHKIEDQKCMDAVVDAFVAKLKEDLNYLPDEACIYRVFNEDLDLSQTGLGKLFAMVYAHNASPKQLAAIFRDTEESFHTAVAIEFAKLRDGDEKRMKVVDMDICEFHGHAAEEPCERRQRVA